MLATREPITVAELNRIFYHSGSSQRFYTYEEVLKAFLDLEKRYPNHVKVVTERLPSGQFLFEAVVGDLHAETQDALLLDPHAEEFPGYTAGYKSATHVLHDVLTNGTKRCLRVYGSSPDHAKLMVPAIRLANRVSGTPRFRFLVPQLSMLSPRHPDPTQTTDWAGGTNGKPPTTLGRAFVEHRLRELARGHGLRAWIANHAAISAGSHALIQGPRSFLTDAANALQTAADFTAAWSAARATGYPLPFSGRSLDYATGGDRPLGGSRAVFRQTASRAVYELTRDNVQVGPTMCEFLLELFPGVVSITPEIAQLREIATEQLTGDAYSLEHFESRVNSYFSVGSVSALLEGAMHIAQRLPDSDLLVQMTRAAESGPAKWGTPKAGIGSAEPMIPDAFSSVDVFAGAGNYVSKALAPAGAMLAKYADLLTPDEKEFAADFSRVHWDTATYSTFEVYDISQAREMTRLQTLLCEVFMQSAAGRELDPRLTASSDLLTGSLC